MAPEPMPPEEKITAIGSGVVELLSFDQSHKGTFARLGGKKTGILGGMWRFEYGDQGALANLLGELMALGATASDHGPARPGAVVADLRARGLLD